MESQAPSEEACEEVSEEEINDCGEEQGMTEVLTDLNYQMSHPGGITGKQSSGQKEEQEWGRKEPAHLRSREAV